MPITEVLAVKTSINEEKLEFLTSIDWKLAASLLQLSLNCLMMFEILSNLKREKDISNLQQPTQKYLSSVLPMDIPVLVPLGVRDHCSVIILLIL